MKKLFATIAVVLFFTAVGTPQQAMAGNEAANEPTSTESSAVLYSSYYSGTIGSNLYITMYLQYLSNGNYVGWYYYNKYGPNNKLRLEGYEEGNGTVKLFEYSNGNVTGSFEGVFNSRGEFIGTMYAIKSQRRLSCRLVPFR